WRAAPGPGASAGRSSRSGPAAIDAARGAPAGVPCFPLVLAFPFRLPLVPVLLAARQGDLHLDAPPLEVNPQRDERRPSRPGAAGQLEDFVPVHQQLAGAQRVVVGVAAVRVRGDMDVVQEDLAAVDAGEAVL